MVILIIVFIFKDLQSFILLKIYTDYKTINIINSRNKGKICKLYLDFNKVNTLLRVKIKPLPLETSPHEYSFLKENSLLIKFIGWEQITLRKAMLEKNL